MVSPNENVNWVFDYGLLEDIPVPGCDHPPALDPSAELWASHSFTNTASVSAEFDDSLGNSDDPKESGSRKRLRPDSSNAPTSKACREKLRRDKLSDKFMELGALLDPGRPVKMDKSAILVDAVRTVTQLRDEARKLKETNDSLQEKINELKAEKNELRDEKQRLKTEKENLEWQVKALSTPPGFLTHHSATPATFSAPGQVVGSKLVPYVGYPGMPMWQFLQPAIVDGSQDHVRQSPAA